MSTDELKVKVKALDLVIQGLLEELQGTELLVDALGEARELYTRRVRAAEALEALDREFGKRPFQGPEPVCPNCVGGVCDGLGPIYPEDVAAAYGGSHD